MAREDRLILALQALGRGSESYFQRKRELERMDREEALKQQEMLQRQQEKFGDLRLKALELARGTSYYDPNTQKEITLSEGIPISELNRGLPGLGFPEDLVIPRKGQLGKPIKGEKVKIYFNPGTPEDVINARLNEYRAQGLNVEADSLQPAPGAGSPAPKDEGLEAILKRLNEAQVDAKNTGYTPEKAQIIQALQYAANQALIAKGKTPIPVSEFEKPGWFERITSGQFINPPLKEKAVIAPFSATPQEVPVINSQAEYDALPKGMQYKDSTGKIKVKR